MPLRRAFRLTGPTFADHLNDEGLPKWEGPLR